MALRFSSFQTFFSKQTNGSSISKLEPLSEKREAPAQGRTGENCNCKMAAGRQAAAGGFQSPVDQPSAESGADSFSTLARGYLARGRCRTTSVDACGSAYQATTELR